MWKKIVSIIMAILMFASFDTFVVFAAEDKPVYLLVGDSITLGSGLENHREACYGKIVADTNGYEYNNFSHDGETSWMLLDHLQDSRLSYYVDAVKKADIISISIGGDDFLVQDDEFLSEKTIKMVAAAMIKKDYTKIDEIIDHFYRNLCEIIGVIKEYNPDVVILMQTLYNPQRGQLKETYQHAVDGINNSIRRYDQENPGDIVIVDVETKLGNNRKYFATDTIHPSAKGNEKIAVIILEKLKELGLGTKTEPVINAKGIDTEMPVPVGLMIELLGTVFNIASVFYRIYDAVADVFR